MNTKNYDMLRPFMTVLRTATLCMSISSQHILIPHGSLELNAVSCTSRRAVIVFAPGTAHYQGRQMRHRPRRSTGWLVRSTFPSFISRLIVEDFYIFTLQEYYRTMILSSTDTRAHYAPMEARPVRTA